MPTDDALDFLGNLTGNIPTPETQPHATQQQIQDILTWSQTKKKATMEQNPTVSSPLMRELIKYPTLQLRKTVHNAFEKARKYEQVEEIVQDECIFGIEIEMENVPNPVTPTAYWTPKTDGSLRNHGIEYVSIPMRPDQIELSLVHLKESLSTVVGNAPDFNPRTSVHVHLNVRDLTQDQLYVLVLLYCIFEKHFFAIAGKKREKSIFCVPLYKTNFVRNRLEQLIYRLRRSWSKYCSLNLCPVIGEGDHAYGTVEFRHLYGTMDPAIIVPWCRNIQKLRKAAQKIPKKDLLDQLKQMNSSSSYEYLYTQIFGNDVQKIYYKDIEECITILKQNLFHNYLQENTVHKISTKCAYLQIQLDLATKNKEEI